MKHTIIVAALAAIIFVVGLTTLWRFSISPGKKLWLELHPNYKGALLVGPCSLSRLTLTEKRANKSHFFCTALINFFRKVLTLANFFPAGNLTLTGSPLILIKSEE
jgi:hypothetical protein